MYFYLDPLNLTGKIIHCRTTKMIYDNFPPISVQEVYLLLATGEWSKCPGDICSSYWPEVTLP